MPSVDYFVATTPYDEAVQARYPRAFAEFANAPVRVLYGYKIHMQDQVGIGLNYAETRVMVIGTGVRSHYAMALYKSLHPGDISVARIDIQVTLVDSNADRTIAWLQPAKAYRATRWSAVGEPGETLYVGSPSSDARLRVYNKSAESGIKPEDGGDFLRIEVQLRNRYADKAYSAIAEGKIEHVWQYWVRKMLNPDDATGLIMRAVGSEVHWTLPVVEDQEDWVSRRKRWVETSVVPALRRLLVHDPDYLVTLVTLLTGKAGRDTMGVRTELRDNYETEEDSDYLNS